MRLLLDTHVLLWWVIDDPKLPHQCAAWIEDRANDVAISAVSAYEIRFKALKGLLPHGEAAIVEILVAAGWAGFVFLPLTCPHAVAAGALPLPHRDPFDRLPYLAEAIGLAITLPYQCSSVFICVTNFCFILPNIALDAPKRRAKARRR